MADPLNLTYTIGHQGCDYGSSAQSIVGYLVPYNVGIAVGVGSYLPMNCSMSSKEVIIRLD
jgi:hypothetical protein